MATSFFDQANPAALLCGCAAHFPDLGAIHDFGDPRLVDDKCFFDFHAGDQPHFGVPF